MPLLLASLLGGIIQVCGSLVGRVLLSLGMSFMVFAGINIGFDLLKSVLLSNMQGLGADTINLMSYLWVDKAISMMLSAYTAALALKMAGGTTITKLVTK